MYRELIGNLLEWKKSETRKPLILKGVRQCGKTYLLREFGSKYYEDTAYFNFEENEALLSVFEKDYDVNRIIFELELHHRRSIRPEQTLIIFDEVQECPRALTALKYFAKTLRSTTLYAPAHFWELHFAGSCPFRWARWIL